MPVPRSIHTNRKADPSRGNEWMDNHLLKRETLRQPGTMAIRTLSLISAVSLYCVQKAKRRTTNLSAKPVTLKFIFLLCNGNRGLNPSLH